MILFKRISDLQTHLQKLRQENKTIGFAPTMGALHEGHLSLIKASQEEVDITICSIFVNPTQFNDSKDFEKYPITIDNDIYLLEKQRCDILFLPSVNEIYPNGKELKQLYDLGFIESILEGAFRPGHFQGVCQVVDRLLEIVQPDLLFMGQKDYQQIMVVKKMIELKNHKAKVIVVPIFREPSGLASSSRNMRLTNDEKEKATAIYQSLIFIKENISRLFFVEIKQQVAEMLMNSEFQKIDYIEICNAETLEPLEKYDKTIKLVALIAAFIGEVRLIDNMIL
ncbi:pantoate--beta-alanine ligase [Arachidicoccus ginsenosidimutans]|uniref:pantoate--beta-alanine ligase n=1 Tax=Arachidicoccus sp. BS20 TaxID=1850526 RepID=UPI0007F09F5D|nr:pantoate--beta-alanine ligase [Arachidicoccus sp. BS20]ANI89588.1 pantoate--beta-alanine ligase [Arachidicoccus sp. BS20]